MTRKLPPSLSHAILSAQQRGGDLWIYGGFAFGARDLEEAQRLHRALMARKYGENSAEANFEGWPGGWKRVRVS